MQFGGGKKQKKLFGFKLRCKLKKQQAKPTNVLNSQWNLPTKSQENVRKASRVH